MERWRFGSSRPGPSKSQVIQREPKRAAACGFEAWLQREAAGLEDGDLVICSEPMWLCPYVRPRPRRLKGSQRHLKRRRRRSKTMLGLLHMALLNEHLGLKAQKVHGTQVPKLRRL